MRDEPLLNFVGNVEGKDIFKGVVDVVVCDGFVGNIVLKFTEGLSEGIFQTIVAEVQEFDPSLMLNLKPVMKKIYTKHDWQEYGGAPLLGVWRVLSDLSRTQRSPGHQKRYPCW
ncbi:MAG: hypothetical protein KatS3mg104_1580 [Phycisphaerae bacterium]|nr:MAG: hypothetical protein KatS3mg104_1580 [Phycisphaerae bacterium]